MDKKNSGDEEKQLLIRISKEMHKQAKFLAIADVALEDSFLELNTSTIHAYLWTLYDLVNEAKKMNEHS